LLEQGVRSHQLDRRHLAAQVCPELARAALNNPTVVDEIDAALGDQGGQVSVCGRLGLDASVVDDFDRPGPAGGREGTRNATTVWLRVVEDPDPMNT
jgi:hypothetical protein